MAMIQRPNAVGLLLCKETIVEAHTRNLTLVNTFRRIVVDSFPSAPQRLTVHALLTDGLGTMTLALQVSRLDTLNDIYEQSRSLTFTDPLLEQYLLVRTSRLSFPVAGRYEFRLLADGQPVAQCVLDVLQRSTQDG
jgi:hypothetical protein